jgi:hypothetical protein
MFKTYGKSIVAFVYAVALVGVPLASGDHHVDAAEGVQIAIAVCTNGLVLLVPLVPSAPWTKTALGAALAGLNVVAAVLVGGINGSEWLSVFAAVLAALGITVAPAFSPKTQTASGVGASLR